MDQLTTIDHITPPPSAEVGTEPTNLVIPALLDEGLSVNALNAN